MSATRLYESITRYLDEADEVYQSDDGKPDDRVITSDISGDDGQWRMFIRILDDAELRLVMIRAFIPARIPESNRLKVAELLTRINYDLFIGNFELNLGDGEVSFKNSVEFVDGVLTQAMFERMYAMCCHATNDNYAKILNAGYGEITPAKPDAETLPDGVMLQ